MTKDLFDAILKSCKRKKDLLAQLPMIKTDKVSGQYINAQLSKLISKFGYSIDYVSDENIRNRWHEYKKEEYYKSPNYCLACGKVIQFESRNSKFCNSSCAARYNNLKRPPKTVEEKQKISEGVRNSLADGRFIPHNQFTANQKNSDYKLLSECIKDGQITNYLNVSYKDRYINLDRCKTHICPICGKSYTTYLDKSGYLSDWHTCSYECKHESMRRKVSEKTQERIKNGTFVGWQSRNILSYPEKFWINVLNNNNINFVPNKPFKYNNNHIYFLDFYIEINDRKIDLEIDGKQHKYADRIISDETRNELVSAAGIEVYRIDWNEINSDEGKEKMKSKIDDFLNFLHRK